MRRVLLGAIALVLVALVAGAHWYIARRLVLDPGVVPPLRDALLAAIAVLFGLVVLQPVADHVVGPPRARLVTWPAAVWMGVGFLLLTLLGVSDAAIVLLGAATRADPTSVAAVRALGVVALAGAGALVGLRNGLAFPALRRVEIRLARWPRGLDGFRIVQVSDLHLGPLLDRPFAARLVARVNALAPDLIAVTGDLVDGSVRTAGAAAAPLAGLAARHGVFFVTGNHDYYSGADAWIAHVRSLGMRVLRNERIAIGDGDAVFDLAGVDDRNARFFGGDHGEDVPRALAGRDPARPVVLLAHDPGTFARAARHDVDLQLSGHTHGGQIWPFGYVVRLAIGWVAGHYRRGASQLYVSRGTGFWGPPMRLGAPAELTEIVLRPEGA
jgi:uncharacterized protein